MDSIAPFDGAGGDWGKVSPSVSAKAAPVAVDREEIEK
jgi:hypothetical protein